MFKLFKQKKYMDWGEYKHRITFIEDYFFQQSVRQANVRHLT
jgi:hypothetical protein